MTESAGAAEFREARKRGSVAALATRSQRDLLECVAAHPDLFPDRPFDHTLVSAVALANAFGSPDATADRVRVANRTALWIFAVDWLLDHVAATRAEVERLVEGCLDVADGRPPSPGFSLGRFLAGLRAEMAAAPAFAGREVLWMDALRDMLTAMAREWDWKAAAREGETLPKLEEYLGNADNFGSSFVNVSHWIHGGDPETLRRLDELRIASDEVQRVLRLLNDLATYERDMAWGDLNAQMLGVGRDEVLERIEALTEECWRLFAPLRDPCPDEVAYLERQLGYSAGFYGGADYWGEL
ncbi:terpene synthase family protein [Microbispora sp. NPDC049125]|uniref:terpene synthase family protein n=1 Tax=Microbispora sp. NPDC049125 TaxID=3154929 RepID=UPI0034650511